MQPVFFLVVVNVVVVARACVYCWFSSFIRFELGFYPICKWVCECVSVHVNGECEILCKEYLVSKCGRLYNNNNQSDSIVIVFVKYVQGPPIFQKPSHVTYTPHAHAHGTCLCVVASFFRLQQFQKYIKFIRFKTKQKKSTKKRTCIRIKSDLKRVENEIRFQFICPFLK